MEVTDKLPDKNIDRLIIDLSSVGRASHHLGKDEEGYYAYDTHPTKGTERKTWINTSEHAFENMIRTYLHVLELSGTAPFATVVVRDGANSRSERQKFLPSYKGHRIPGPPELNVEFNKFCDLFCDTVKSLGGTVAYQDGMEADDVIAYLSKKLQGHKTIWSTDGDMLALQSDTVDIYQKQQLNPPLSGCPVVEWIPIYKALVGDKSDNLKGAKGFGDKAFLELVTIFGDEGMEAMKDLLETGQLNRLREDVGSFKPLQKIIDNQDEVYACYECAKFLDRKVNTLRSPLVIESGYCHQYDKDLHHPDLAQWYGSSYLIDSNNYDDFKEDIIATFKESPFVSLDIEGSTPEESDEWCRAIMNAGSTKKKKMPFDSFSFGVDGVSLTFGDNLQNTIYMTIGHLDSANLTNSQVKYIVDQIPRDKRTIVHNSSFELPTVFRAWGETDLDNGFRGYLPNVWCTVLMHQYVNENIQSHLKGLSKLYFDYDQVTFDEVSGGKKMNQLTAKHVTDYACDDTIMTAALANRLQLIMEIEGTLDTFEKVEFYPQYVCADAFNKGVAVDLNRLAEIEAEDDIAYDEAWEVVKKFLTDKAWPGTRFSLPSSYAAAVKYCFKFVHGFELKTKVRKANKLAEACLEAGANSIFAKAVETENIKILRTLAEKNFTGEPEFKISSPNMMCKIMYGEINSEGNPVDDLGFFGLPVRLRNKPTDKMREAGRWEGNPKADNNAIRHALKFDVEEGSYEHTLLKAFQKMTEIDTRRKLFYRPYKVLVHWKDGRFHPNLGQSRTVTRRFAPNGPNVNQMSKRGEGKKLREVIIPYSDTQIIEARDYDGQELVLTADTSKDPAMMSCYSGKVRKDIHSMTGAKIALIAGDEKYSDYDYLKQQVDAGDPVAKSYRTPAKSVNFGYVYDITAGGLATDLLVDEEEAQNFLDAYDAAFPGVPAWKKTVVARLKKTGHSYTRLGAVRHLAHAILSENSWERKKAERQAVNYVIQGSAGEQTKLAIGRMWLNGYLYEGDCQFYFPVHDEVVQSVDKVKAPEISKKIEADMTAQYADMELTMTAGPKSGPNFGQLTDY